MARKRIKTLANEWGVPVEDVLKSCDRLKLAHAHSESILLAPDEVERIQADLAAQAHREAALCRETVVETSAGKIVEKRLTATVMRRRHAESAPAPVAGAETSEPFHFELEEKIDEPFGAPFLAEERAAAGIETPALFETGPEAVAEPAPAMPRPESETRAGELAREHPAAETRTGAGPAATPSPLSSVAQAGEAPQAGAGRGPEALRPEPFHGERREVQRPEPVRPAAAVPPAGARALNLTRGAHPSAPSLDDGQRGPKVLGRIDLRAKIVARPAAPVGRYAGMPPRPGVSARPTGAPAPLPAQPPAEGTAAKPAPAGRTVKRKRVVKKASDFLAEREIRGLRVPKKRRALPGKEQHKTEITTPKASKRVVRITEGVTVGDLGRSMGVKAGDLIKKLMELGQMATVNQVIDADTASLIAGAFGYTVENITFDAEQEIEAAPRGTETGEALPRPPVVTVMGHVDHGKTSLLDAIRRTNVTAAEYGGITQHIGAYTVEAGGRTITFVDTPGHEAFTAMRARGAKVTDIVVLVVAANEGVMPQTVEAMNHARAANVPILVAINKIDLPDANLDRVKQRLSEAGLIPEDYGGDTIAVPVSARTREGIDKLLEMVLLQAEVMELKANPARPSRGTVIEAQLDRGRGPVATVLIQEGTLRQGDPFVCGVSYGRVRAMLNHLGQRVTEAGPSTPVEIFGLSSVPEPGLQFVAMGDEGKARQVAEFRRSRQREGELQKTSRVSLEDLSQRMLAGEVKELKIVIKADVQGSVEALQNALERLATAEVKLQVLHASAGAISETDVTLAAASKAIVVGFNVRPEPKAAQLAEREGVEVRLYTIIYEAIDDVREAMEGLLAPTFREKPLGRAEVRKTFSVPGGAVAGSMVVEGKIVRAARARLIRDGRVVWEGKIGSLRRFREDAREVTTGYECGIGLENYNDVKPGDVVEAFEMETVLRKLTPARGDAGRGHAPAEKHLPT